MKATNEQSSMYNLCQIRIKRICMSEYLKAPKRKDGRPKKPLTYPATVHRLVELSSESLGASPERLAEIYAEITGGQIQYDFLKG